MSTPLPVVDGLALPPRLRELLKPGELIVTGDGDTHRLPRFFYAVASWQLARETELSPHFRLWEFMDVDVREPSIVRAFPRYVPCAVTLLASALETFRVEAGTPVRIMANGGYRSPAHAATRAATCHCWGTAADIFRVGSEYLDAPDRLDRFTAMLRRVLPFARLHPAPDAIAPTDDHLHLDLGYVTLAPPGASEGDQEKGR